MGARWTPTSIRNSVRPVLGREPLKICTEIVRRMNVCIISDIQIFSQKIPAQPNPGLPANIPPSEYEIKYFFKHSTPFLSRPFQHEIVSHFNGYCTKPCNPFSFFRIPTKKADQGEWIRNIRRDPGPAFKVCLMSKSEMQKEMLCCENCEIWLLLCCLAFQ